MRLLILSLTSLAMLGLDVPHRALAAPRPQSSPATTATETSFAQTALRTWVAPYAEFKADGPFGPGAVHPSVYGLRLDVDSHEVVHTAQVILGKTQDGTLNTHSIIYQNNLFETRRTNGFSDPVVLKTVIEDSNPPYSDDRGYGVSSIDLVVEKDDTVHVVWTQAVPRPFQDSANPSGTGVFFSRIFYRSRTNGVWSGITQLTPDVDTVEMPLLTEVPPPPGGYNTPYVFGPSHLPRSLKRLYYQNPLVKKGADGRAYLLTHAEGLYDYRSLAYGEIINRRSNFSYLAYAQLGGPLQIIPTTVTKVGLFTGSGEVDQNGTNVLNAESPISSASFPHFAVSPTGTFLMLWFFSETNAVNFPTMSFAGWCATGTDFGGLDERVVLPHQEEFPVQPNMLSVAFDPGGDSHVYWNISIYPVVQTARYRPGPMGATQILPGIDWLRAIHVDDQGQHHFLTSDLSLGANRDFTIFSRLKDPQTRRLADGFVQTGVWAGSGFDNLNPFRSDIPIGAGAVLSKNGRLYVAAGDSLTHSRAPVLGVRDSAAMVGAFPGGQVNVTSGNLHSRINLFSTNGVGPAQSVDLVYNSLEPVGGYVGSCWKLSPEIYLVDHWQYRTGFDIITLVEADGREVPFGGIGLSGVYIGGSLGHYSRIERVSPNSLVSEYKLTTKTGDVMWFNTNGRLRRVEDPSGRFMEFIYSGGSLVQITDMSGQRSTGFQYEGGSPIYGSRVTGITDPAGGQYSLEYSGTLLSGITFSSGPGAPNYGFEYYDASNPATGALLNLMSRFKTPRGNRWTCLYHRGGRVASVQDPSESFLLDSASDSALPTQQVASASFSYDGYGTQLTDRRGFRTMFVGDSGTSFVGGISDEAVLNGGASGTLFPIIRSFDGAGNLTGVQDRWGFTTTYVYTLGTPAYVQNLDRVFKPQGGVFGEELVASYTYTTDGFNQVKTATTFVTPTGGSAPQARTTTYDYNAYRQVTEVKHPDVSLPDVTTQTGITTNYEYNGPRRQLTRITNEEGNSTDFSNFDGIHGLARNVLRQGGSQPLTMAYDVMGNLVQQTMPRGSGDNETPGPATTILDGLYRVQYQIDPAGLVTTFEYDVDSHLTRVTPPAGLGGFTTTAYDKRGFVSGGTSPDGNWSQFVDANGSVRRSVDLRGFASNFSYDFLGRSVSSRLPGESTLPGGAGGGGTLETSASEYDLVDADGRFMRTTAFGASNRVTRTYFDNRARVRLVIAPDNQTKVETFYNELDQVIARQQVFGAAVQTCSVSFRDERDRVNHVRTQNTDFRAAQLDQHSDTYTVYNRAGSVKVSVDPLGNVAAPGYAHKTTYLRDARERVDAVVDGMGVIVAQYLYGDDDLVKEVRVPDPSKKSAALVTASTRAYTSRKELLNERDVLGNGNAYEYLLPGQLSKATDAANNVTRTTYDPMTQRVDTVIEAQGTASENQTKHVWNNGLLTETKVWNPETLGYNATFARAYDQAGRLERCGSPAVGQGKPMADERYFYNNFGELNLQIAGTKVREQVHDLLGRTTKTTWHGAYSAENTYTYNGAGQVETVSDGAIAKTMFYETWKGTPHTESISVAGQAWKAQMHLFDNAGNQTGFGDGEGGQHQWPVDENNRPTEVRYNDQTSRSISYTPGGLVDQEVLRSASGTAIATTVHTYDRLGRRIGSQTVQSETKEVLTYHGWEYDERHLVKEIHLHHLAVKVTLGLDSRGRPATESTPGNSGGQNAPAFENEYGGDPTGNASPDSEESSASARQVLAVAARSATYVFHASGNRQSAVIDGVQTTYAYNAANQLQTETSATKTVEHEHDEWGNEVKRTTTPVATPENPTPVPLVERYGYNHLNLMSTYTNSASGANWQYDFYPTGERYGKTNLAAAESELYVPRFGDVATEYTKLGIAAPFLKNSYVQGLGIDSKQFRIAQDGTRRHFLSDKVGTLGMTLDDAGATLETSVKDAWGVPMAGGSSERYSGLAQREVDTESGLVHMRARMYDPRIGRFTQTDPILGNRPFKHYAYASNNPVSRMDPWGLDDDPWLLRKALALRRAWDNFVDSPGNSNPVMEAVRGGFRGVRNFGDSVGKTSMAGTEMAAHPIQTHEQISEAVGQTITAFKEEGAINALAVAAQGAWTETKEAAQNPEQFSADIAAGAFLAAVPSPMKLLPGRALVRGSPSPRVVLSASKGILVEGSSAGALRVGEFVPGFGWKDPDWKKAVKLLQEGQDVEVRTLRVAAELRRDAFPDFSRSKYRGPLGKAPDLSGTYDWHDPAVVPHPPEHRIPHIQIWNENNETRRIMVNPTSQRVRKFAGVDE